MQQNNNIEKNTIRVQKCFKQINFSNLEQILMMTINTIIIMIQQKKQYTLYIIYIQYNYKLTSRIMQIEKEKEIDLKREEIMEDFRGKFTKEYEEIQYAVLSYSGLKVPEEICSVDVPIGDNQWIHEIRCGFEKKRDLVLLHGYGGTSMAFIRIFKELSTQFRVHALDALGMGLSSRKTFLKEWGYAQTIQYFVNAIENWRIQSKIDKFTLGGHSFGGYLASCYAQKYPERVERLILISPAGVKFMTRQMTDNLYLQLRQKATFGHKLFLSFTKLIIKYSPTPSKAFNTIIIGKYFLEKALSGRFKLKQSQKQAWKAYYNKVTRIKSNSQKCVFKIFHYPGFGSQQPIQKKITENKFNFPIEFYYGDEDRMQKLTAQNLCNSTIIPNKLKYTIIIKSSHQIVFDNPQMLANFILARN